MKILGILLATLVIFLCGCCPTKNKENITLLENNITNRFKPNWRDSFVGDEPGGTLFLYHGQHYFKLENITYFGPRLDGNFARFEWNGETYITTLPYLYKSK